MIDLLEAKYRVSASKQKFRSKISMKRSLIIGLLLMLLLLANAYGQSARSRPTENSGKKTQKQETPAPTPTPEPEIKSGNEPAGDDVVKVSTDLVSFPVSVFDRRGRNIFDLKKEEFQIFEDGKPQEIAFFATTEQPFTVVLMLDISLSTRFKITDIQSAAIAFLDQLRPEDKVMVIAFAENVFTLSDFTSDRDQLKRAIRGTRFRDGTSIYDAFKITIDRLKRITGRKAIVMFTDGVDTTSKKSYLNENLRDADELDAIIFPIEFNTYADVKRMERQGTVDAGQTPPKTDGPLSLPGDISVDVGRDNPRQERRNEPRNEPVSIGDDQVVSGSPGTSRAEYEKASRYLADLADRTGGKVEKATTLYDIENAFTRIAQGLRQQYSIGYYPPDIEKTGVARKVKVKVTRQNLVVRSRETYTIGEGPNKKARAK
jgi:VWFA-related protein